MTKVYWVNMNPDYKNALFETKRKALDSACKDGILYGTRKARKSEIQKRFIIIK